MAYSETIELVQGDRLPQITVTLRDKNTAAPGKTLDPEDPTTWATIDLSGGTVRMRVRAIGSTTTKDTIVGTITDAVNGKVTFLFSATTLDTAGLFEAEIEFTDPSSRTQTVYDLIKFKVREQFG